MPVKSKVEISQNFVAFSEYMDFMKKLYVCTNKILSLIIIAMKKCVREKKSELIVFQRLPSNLIESAGP